MDLSLEDSIESPEPFVYHISIVEALKIISNISNVYFVNNFNYFIIITSEAIEESWLLRIELIERNYQVSTL